MKPQVGNPGIPILPKEAYTSQKWFDREQKYLFSKTWHFAGMVDDFKTIGDRSCVQAGYYHILIVRDKNDTIRAFHAQCRHRGTKLDAHSAKKTNLITCPYHNWTYDLKGKLIAVPQKNEIEELEFEQYGLYPAKVEIFRHMVFIHPDPDAEKLLSWLGSLPQKMGSHKPEELIEYEGGKGRYEIKANWKIFAENYMDGYHLKYLHTTTLNMYDHLKQTWSFDGLHWTFFEPLEPEYLKWAQSYPNEVISHIAPEEMGAYVHLLFPNLGITETESDWSTIEILPIAPDRTIVQVRTRTPKASTIDSVSGWFSGSKKTSKDLIRLSDVDNPLSSGDFMMEDIYVCEKLQESMASPKFQTGPMAMGFEDTIVHYQTHILNILSKKY